MDVRGLVAETRSWFVLAPGERPLSRIVLILTAPLVVIVLGGGLFSLVMGTVPKGGRYTSIAVVVYGLVLAWPNLQIVRGRATPAHLVVALLLEAPNSLFDAWLTDRHTTWIGPLIPVVVAAVVAMDLAWRLHRRNPPEDHHPPETNNRGNPRAIVRPYARSRNPGSTPSPATVGGHRPGQPVGPRPPHLCRRPDARPADRPRHSPPAGHRPRRRSSTRRHQPRPARHHLSLPTTSSSDVRANR